jgi:hypothetical protein
MAVGLQVWSQTAASNANADTNINWAEGMAPSQVDDSARAEMSSMAKWRDDNNGSIVTSGSSTAYTAVTSQIEGSLTAGYTVAVQFHASNDSSATLNVDSLGGKPLQVVAGINLKGGEFRTGSIARFTYSSTGTGQWIAQGAEQTSPGAIDGSNAFTGNVGEYQSTFVTTSAAVAVSTSAGVNVTSLALTAGDWEISASLHFTQAMNVVTAAISNATGDTTHAADVSPSDGFDVWKAFGGSNATASGLFTRASSASSATYYLNIFGNWTGSQPFAYGAMRARRIR